MVTPAKIWDMEFDFEVTLKKKSSLFSHKCSIIILKKKKKKVCYRKGIVYEDFHKEQVNLEGSSE